MIFHFIFIHCGKMAEVALFSFGISEILLTAVYHLVDEGHIKDLKKITGKDLAKVAQGSPW
jgi:hypothetical protein